MRYIDTEQLAARRTAMLAALPIGVILLDDQGRVIEANPAAQRVFGLPWLPRTLQDVGRRVGHPISGAPFDEPELPWQRALAGERCCDRDLAIVAMPPDTDQRVITVSAKPFHDPVTNAAGALVVAFDRVQLLLRRTNGESAGN